MDAPFFILFLLPGKLVIEMDKKHDKGKTSDESGFSLVELLAVVIIVGILAAIAVPMVINQIDKTENEVCAVNRETVKKDYERRLLMNSVIHTTEQFNQFVNESGLSTCPAGGSYQLNRSADQLEVICNVHVKELDDEENGGGDSEVPWL
ncbi:type II secretion system protein [Sporosarcina trichiuri]|uniref:type II secretion system protein n=1 Tax=Sporosarcina trichiuri TaxID=3056445 RepID=UPI0025B3D1DC|nr:type II secretion system protein [Sporosarcina sp. 0.2-SM1T-5]WJY26424.1 type II secretion system protein [Sporosarcina sp. 0.2-SM1T-5]